MSKKEQGFTLIEMTVATGLLSVAVLGLAMTVPAALVTNHRNRIDSEAAMLVERQLEQISAQPLNSASFVDASGNTVSLGPGGSALVGGKVDFSGAAVNGYNATIITGAGTRFELRWNVLALADGAKQFTIAGRKLGGERFLAPPVNFSLRLGR